MTRPPIRSLALLLGIALLAPVGAHAAQAPESTAYAATPHVTTAHATKVRSDHVRTAHGAQPWTTYDRMVPVVTGPANDLHFDLATRLYVPRKATAKHPQPAIIMAPGFGNTEDSAEMVSTARFFAAHGYVVLTYTSSGFGTSGGCVTLQSADYDVKSARQLIDRVLEPRKDVLHDRHGAVIGQIGGSYGGGIQLPLAATDRRIHTSIVGRSWNNLLYSLDPNNRVLPGDATGLFHPSWVQGVFKQEWTTLFYALGNAQPAMMGGGCLAAKTAQGDPGEIANAGDCPGYLAGLCRAYTFLTSTGNSDKRSRHLIARASGSTFITRVHTPVLLVQGQSDTLFNENDATSTYLALKRQHTPVGMIWNSGGHGGYDSQPGECEAYDGVLRSVAQMDHCYLSLRSLYWMDHWLRGTKTGRGPAFSYYRDWVAYAGHGPDDEQYGVSSHFPLKATTTFTLSGTDALAAPGAKALVGSDTLVNPAGGEPAAYSETSNFTGPDSSPSLDTLQPTEVAGQFAQFTTKPLTRTLTSVGIPAAHLRITNSNGRDLVFFAKVYDVAPDGTAQLIHRLIAPVRVPAAAVGRPVDLRLLGFAHRFVAGHSIRLVLCTTDQTSYNDKIADTLTVTTGPGTTFTIPGSVR